MNLSVHAALTKKRKISVIVHLSGVQIVPIRCILFVLCMMEKKKEERRTKSKFLHSIFSTVRRSNGTLGLYFT